MTTSQATAQTSAARPVLILDAPALLADPALLAVLDALPPARLVGGSVRDTLAGRPVSDIDLAVPWPPAQVMQALGQAGLRAIPTGLAHGTVTALSAGRGFEVTTLRRDEDTDGRHARVAWTEDWRQDAARRDFTINALSMTRAGEVFDYFAGIADLRAGRVRFVGDAAARVAEDRLRALRFFRFQARYGRGAPDPAATAAIAAQVADLRQLSAERVWTELRLILSLPDPSDSLRLMADLGVLATILPGSRAESLLAALAAGIPADPVLRLAVLITGDGAAEAELLRLSGSERDRLLALRRQPPIADPSPDDATLRRLLADTPASLLIGGLWVAGAFGPQWDKLRERLARMPRPVFGLEGRDALALGLPPGPRVGALLRAVRDWWRNGGCVADPAACRAELARRAAEG